MKPRLRIFIVAMMVAIPIYLSAQQNGEQKAKHRCYRVVILGTDGGKNSYAPGFSFYAALTHRGAMGVRAETDVSGIDHSYIWAHGRRTNLETPPVLPGSSGNTTNINWINRWDLAVGSSTNGKTDPIIGGPENNAVVWTPDGRITNLGTLGGYQSEATWVNDLGQVTGWVENTTPNPFYQAQMNFGVGPDGAGAETQMFIWDGGTMRRMGTLGGPDSFGGFINNRGQVAGWSFLSDVVNSFTSMPPFDPFVWQNGKMTDIIPGDFGGAAGGPNFMNEKGQVVGFADLYGDVDYHPFLWDNGKVTDLFTVGNLGGSFGNGFNVNEEGHVVGVSSLSGDEAYHAVLWRDSEFTDLGTLPGDSCSQPYRINSHDQIVGFSGACNFSTTHAFLWENGEMVDLNMLIPADSGIQLNYAGWINERGEIAGDGVLRASGETRAALLIPDRDCDDECEAAIMARQQQAELAAQAAGTATLSPAAKAQLRIRALRPIRPAGMPEQKPISR